MLPREVDEPPLAALVFAVHELLGLAQLRQGSADVQYRSSAQFVSCGGNRAPQLRLRSGTVPTMFDHPHPGEILEEEVLDVLGLSVTEAARPLGMTRPNLSRVLNAQTGVSPDLALRLEAAGVSTARFWMSLQTNYEFANAARQPRPVVNRLLPLSRASRDVPRTDGDA